MRFLPVLSAAGVASAFSIQQYTRALKDSLKARDEELTLTSTDLTNFEFYAQFAAAAYCNYDADAGAAISCGGYCDDVEDDGATIVASFTGSDTDIAGFVATDTVKEVIVVSIRGSSSIRNWLVDFDFIFSSCSELASGCKVHTGFLDAWNEISTDVKDAIATAQASYPDYPIITTGHSLGAAVATLAATYLREDGIATNLYNYGSPRVGNADLVDFIDSQSGYEYRVTHLDDPVPRLPPIIFEYRHTDVEYWLDDGTDTTVDYALTDIEVCTGIANVDCNAAQSGLDITAHRYYFDYISGCGSSTLSWKRDSSNMTDAELETKLNTYAELDRQYVANMTASA